MAQEEVKPPRDPSRGEPTKRSTESRRSAFRVGEEAEQFVAAALKEQGWSLLASRWRGGGGELDLVVHQGATVRFVEVKARTNDEAVPVEESIGPHKQAKLRQAAEAWLLSHAARVDEAAFMVALVDLSEHPWQVTWIDDAF